MFTEVFKIRFFGPGKSVVRRELKNEIGKV
jgi:hypothetical protein